MQIVFLSMQHCDELATCPCCHSAFALEQLGEAPADPATLSSGRSGY